ncbi:MULTISPECIES: hypothetical protein [unclassified Pseudomonas]|uniref:hypothetical protein n=1 Tax=unclassified Pseudomonas TaxID=196821 RepID=UPI001EEFBD73|nr:MULTISPECIES: hypothetical protein [unclassified Pseudomonas]
MFALDKTKNLRGIDLDGCHGLYGFQSVQHADLRLVATGTGNLGEPMKDDLRNQALTNWRRLFLMPPSLINAEDRYDKLLLAADHMERTQLISSDEWRALVQQAGTSFASTAQCMGGSDQD